MRRAVPWFDLAIGVGAPGAGLVLLGSEVKSLRAGQATLKDAYATIDGGELWLDNLHIAPYSFARGGGHEP